MNTKKKKILPKRNVPLSINKHPIRTRKVQDKVQPEVKTQEVKVSPEIITDYQEIEKVVSPQKHLREDLEGYKWKPGQSGNPSGRPKDELKAIGLRIAQLRTGKILKPKEMQYLKDLGMDTADMRVIEFIMAQLATSRNPQKIEMFLDRVYGKAPNININAEISASLVTRFKSKLTDAELERIASGEDALEILLEKLPDVDNSEKEFVDAEVS